MRFEQTDPAVLDPILQRRIKPGMGDLAFVDDFSNTAEFCACEISIPMTHLKQIHAFITSSQTAEHVNNDTNVNVSTLRCKQKRK